MGLGSLIKSGAKKAGGFLKEHGVDIGLTLLSGMGGSGGLFGGAISRGISGIVQGVYHKKNVNIGVEDIPHMDQPDVITNETNPNLTTIVKQLDSIIKIANKIGVITQEQQDALLEQIKHKRSAAREQDLESADIAQIEQPETASIEALEPLNSAFEELAATVKKLTGIVEHMSQQGGGTGGGAPAPSGGGGGKKGRGRAANLTPAQKKALERKGYKVGSRGGVTRADGSKKRVSSAEINDVLESHATSVERTKALVGAAGAVAPTVGLGLASLVQGYNTDFGRKADVTGEMLKAVQSVGGKTIEQTVGSDKLDKIVIGKNLSPDAAVNNIISGNPAAAGINEPQARLLNEIIPPLRQSLVPDVYKAFYKTDPATDPEAAERLPLILAAIDRMIAESLRRKISKSNAVSLPPATAAAPPPQASPTEKVKPSGSPTPTGAPAAGSPSGGAGAQGQPSGQGTPPPTLEEAFDKQFGAPVPPANASKGLALNTASAQAENALMAPPNVVADNTQTITPQRGPTTLPDSVTAGIGNVHCPLFLRIPSWIVETME